MIKMPIMIAVSIQLRDQESILHIQLQWLIGRTSWSSRIPAHDDKDCLNYLHTV
jgi:hypothetical protein